MKLQRLPTWKPTVAKAIEMCWAFTRGERGPLTKDEVAHLAHLLEDATEDD